MRYVYPTRGDGQIQAPAIKTLGLKIGKIFKLGGNREFELDANIFNVLNAGGFNQFSYNSAYQTWSSDFLLMRNRQQARAFHDWPHGLFPLNRHDVHAGHAFDLANLLDQLDADLDPFSLPGDHAGLFVFLCHFVFRLAGPRRAGGFHRRAERRRRELERPFAQQRHRLAPDSPHFPIRQHAFEPVAHFDPVVMIVYDEENHHATVVRFRPYAPALGQVDRELLEWNPGGRADGHDGDLRLRLLVHLPAERRQLLLRGRIDDPGEIAYKPLRPQLVDLLGARAGAHRQQRDQHAGGVVLLLGAGAGEDAVTDRWEREGEKDGSERGEHGIRRTHASGRTAGRP